MSKSIGAWEIIEGNINRMQLSQIDFEKELEEWITYNPDLVQAGLTIIGRQIHLDGNRAILDLLALDPQGQWVAIEIKKGSLSRDTIAQIIDYASCLASIPEEQVDNYIKPQIINSDLNLRELLKERDALDSLDPNNRDINMIIVGTGRNAELDQMAKFLSNKFGFPLTIVTFHVIESQCGNKIIVRELNEPEQVGFRELSKNKSTPTLEELQLTADQNGIGRMFRLIRETAEEIELYPRLWKTSVMYTSQANKTKSLFTVWVHPYENKIKLYLVADGFNEFFQISKERVESLLGQNGWQYLNEEKVELFTKGLQKLLKTDTADQPL